MDEVGRKIGNVVIQAACLAHEIAAYDDEGSLFTRKLLADLNQSNKLKPSVFVWENFRQHPVFESTLQLTKVCLRNGEGVATLGPFRLVHHLSYF
jgi:hypothetical protein